MKEYNEGCQIILKQEERYRLIGLDETLVVASRIWQHTDAARSSGINSANLAFF